jgi:hypothetical protein
MALNKRERILGALVGLVALAVAAHFVIAVLSTPTGSLWTERETLREKIEKKKLIVERGRKAEAKLAEWDKRALPADRELGRSLYQNWLSELVDKVGLTRSRVESGEGRLHQNAFYLLPFTVRGQGNAEKMVEFLFAFYRAGHLHQIRHLSIKPLEHGRELDLVMTIEALSLPGAKSLKLSSEPGMRLAQTSMDEYVNTFVRRDLFSPFLPGSAAGSGRSKLDPAKYAYLTAVVSVEGRPQAWFVARTTDQVYKLSEGEDFTIGAVRTKVVRIRPRDVDLEIDGSRYTVGLGSSLREGQPKVNGESRKSPNGGS